MQKLEYLCNNHQQRENKIQSLQEIEQTDSVPILTIDFMNRCPSPAPLEARTPEQTEPAFCHFRIDWIIAAHSLQQFWCNAQSKWNRDKIISPRQPRSPSPKHETHLQFSINSNSPRCCWESCACLTHQVAMFSIAALHCQHCNNFSF